MPWREKTNPVDPVERRIKTTLPAASVLEATGYPLDWFSKLKLGIARLVGELEPIERALPSQVHGVPVRGRERMEDFLDFFQPFVSRPSFGKDPQDAYDVLDALEKRSPGLSPTESERARGFLQVYKNVLAKKNAPGNFGFGDEDEEPLYPGQHHQQNRYRYSR
jgi:hypothetical protein